MSDCVKKMQTGCSPEILSDATQIGHAPVFDACLPFGGRLYSKGGFVNYEPPTAPADGTYTSIIVQNGCIVGVGYADISMYTSAPCAPIPCGCGDGGGSSGGGSGGSISISSSANNLSKLDASGALLTTLSVVSGSGISIAGKGTSSDPLQISANAASAASIYISAGNDGLTVSGSGTRTSPYVISHAQHTARNINGMTFDRYGHLTGYTERSSSGTVNGIIGSDGISVDTAVSTGIATVSLSTPLHNLKGEYIIGGQNVELDEFNRIYSITRSINITNGTYRLGRYDVTVNSYGSVTGLKTVPSDATTGPVCVRLTSAGSGASVPITLLYAAGLKIEIEAKTVPTSLSISVDGGAASGAAVGTSKYMALTQAVYAAGSHTVSISGSLPADTFITVTPVIVL